MGALVWIFRVLVLLFIIRLVLRMVFPPRVVRRQPGPSDRTPERLGGELVRDPQCGTHIPKARSIAVGTGADIKYFCSTDCRDAYAAQH